MSTFLFKSVVALAVMTAFSCVDGEAALISKGVPVRIMCMGDSITEGKYLNTGGYRKPLRDLLEANGYVVVYVGKEDDGKPEDGTGCSVGMKNANHEGYGSFRVDEMLTGATEEGRTAPPIGTTLANYHPDVILLMLGTNDIFQNHDIPHIADRMKKLVETIFADSPKTAILLARIPPISVGPEDAWGVAYSDKLAAMVAEEKAAGRNIDIVDQHAPLFHFGVFQVHPSQAGYERMAAVWYRALTGEAAPQAAAK